jgi:hypothetical protein
MRMQARGATFLRDDLNGAVSEMANDFGAERAGACSVVGGGDIGKWRRGDGCHEVSSLMTVVE